MNERLQRLHCIDKSRPVSPSLVTVKVPKINISENTQFLTTEDFRSFNLTHCIQLVCGFQEANHEFNILIPTYHKDFCYCKSKSVGMLK